MGHAEIDPPAQSGDRIFLIAAIYIPRPLTDHPYLAIRRTKPAQFHISSW
jgi:hypothetical protein